MNSKYLFVLMLCISLVATVISTQVCFVSVQASELGKAFVFDASINQASASCTFNNNPTLATQQAQVNTTFVNGIGTAFDPNSGLVNSGTRFGLLDPLFALIALFNIFMGIPVMLLIFSLGLPTMISFLLVTVIYVFYIIGLLEFFRGGAF